MPQAVSLSIRQENRLILTLAALQFCSIVDFIMLMPLGPQLMRVLHVSTAQFGLLVSAYTFSAGLVGFGGAFIVDHIDRRRLLLGLFLGFLLATLGCALAGNYTALLLARLAAGACGGLLGAMVMAYIGDCVPEERRGAATGKVMAAFSMATVAGVPLALAVATLYSWRAPFLLVTALGGLLWWRAWGVLPSVPPRQRDGGDSIGATLRAVLGVGNHWLAFALIAALMLAGFSVIPFISPFMVHNIGLRESQLPWLYLTGGAATLFSAPAIGRLADRYGKPQVLGLTCLLSLAPIYLLTHMQPMALPLVLLVSTVFMVFVSGRLIPAMAMITASCQPALRGRFMSINTAMQQLAASLAAFWPTWVLSTSPDGHLQHYETVGFGAMAMTLVAIWLGGRIRRVS